MKLLLTTLIFLLYCFTASGQINFPRASPACQITQNVGLTKITVDYSRPGRKHRTVFGGLAPYGRIWRVGANESSKITFSQEVIINGHPIPAGTYALYAIPNPDIWTVIIHKNITHWGDGRDKYDPEEDELRFETMVQKLQDTLETCTIGFQNFTHNSTDLVIGWENTQVSFTIEVDTRSQVVAEIREKLKNPTADTYYQAARYFQEEGLESGQALQWLEEALSLIGDTYYIHRVKSLLQAKMEDYSGAIESAEKSMALAAAENKDEFVRMNQGNIKKWNMLIKP